jgi:3'-phosphoadenosine 5'-phosphosulfate sulfotransferase (PAPS reductase)/FAD synthetase
MDLAVVSGTGAAIVSVSEEDGKVSATTGNVDTDHVVLASALTGNSMSSAAGTQESVVLQQIVDAIDNLGGNALTAVTSTGETLHVDAVSENKQNIEFIKEAKTDTTVAAGHLELAQNNSKEWYGVMYWIDEEA